VQGHDDDFDIDDYDHRSFLGDRSHTKMNKVGEVDEYDRIMRRTQRPSSVTRGDAYDWDHRIVRQSRSTSCATAHQPRSITTPEQSVQDDGDDLAVGSIPTFESYLAEKCSVNNDLRTSTTPLVGPDVDDWDHRAIQNLPPTVNRTERASQCMEGDIDDFDHRALGQAIASPPSTRQEKIRYRGPGLDIQGGDIDDYDPRMMETPTVAEQNSAAEDEQGDIDDYDHRSMQNLPPSPVGSKAKGTKLFVLDDDDSVILDNRSKWALGNLTKKDIEEERRASAERESEKKARKEKEAEIRRHAFGG